MIWLSSPLSFPVQPRHSWGACWAPSSSWASSPCASPNCASSSTWARWTQFWSRWPTESSALVCVHPCFHTAWAWSSFYRLTTHFLHWMLGFNLLTKSMLTSWRLTIFSVTQLICCFWLTPLLVSSSVRLLLFPFFFPVMLPSCCCCSGTDASG